MLIFLSGCTVWQATEQNLDLKRDSICFGCKIKPKCIMKTFLRKMVNEFSKSFSLENPNSQILC